MSIARLQTRRAPFGDEWQADAGSEPAAEAATAIARLPIKRASTAKITDIRQRLLRVIDHIDSNLQQRLPLRLLAEKAALSPFHFQRIYTRFVGESPTATVRKLRLNRVASRIAAGELSVTAAAVEAGYSSVQAFSRAFSRTFGTPPSRFEAVPAPALAERKIGFVSSPAGDFLACDFNGGPGAVDEAMNRFYSYALAEGLLNANTQFASILRSEPTQSLTEAGVSAFALIGANAIPFKAPLPLRVIGYREGPWALWPAQGCSAALTAELGVLAEIRLPAMGWRHDPSRPVVQRLFGDHALTPRSLRRSQFLLPVLPA